MSQAASKMRTEYSKRWLNAWIVCGLLFSLLIVQAVFAQDGWDKRKSTDERFAGEAAWQLDKKLGKKWQEITGRFIFQRTCLSCHKQGPASFTKIEWAEKLNDFPDEEHAKSLPRGFGDLTAMFSYGHMVASDHVRYQALKMFLARYAPEQKVVASDADLEDAVDLFPPVGQHAPDFSIVNTEGNEHTPTGYVQDNKTLILVFSRAYW